MRSTAVWLAAALALSSSAAHGQSACRAPHDSVSWLIDRARHWVAPADSIDAMAADSLHVPRAPVTQVHWIRAGALCARAAAAYKRTSGRPAGVSRRVYLIDAGSVYVVLDPEYSYRPGAVQLYSTAIFDHHWHLLALVTG